IASLCRVGAIIGACFLVAFDVAAEESSSSPDTLVSEAARLEQLCHLVDAQRTYRQALNAIPKTLGPSDPNGAHVRRSIARVSMRVQGLAVVAPLATGMPDREVAPSDQSGAVDWITCGMSSYGLRRYDEALQVFSIAVAGSSADSTSTAK